MCGSDRTGQGGGGGDLGPGETDGSYLRIDILGSRDI